MAQHALAARAPLARLGNGELHERADGTAGALADVNGARQRGEQRVERRRVAAEKTADEARRFDPAVADRDPERQLASSGRRYISRAGGWRMPGALDIACGSPCGKTTTSPDVSLIG